jgi:hypothetical protein
MSLDTLSQPLGRGQTSVGSRFETSPGKWFWRPYLRKAHHELSAGGSDQEDLEFLRPYLEK